MGTVTSIARPRAVYRNMLCRLALAIECVAKHPMAHLVEQEHRTIAASMERIAERLKHGSMELSTPNRLADLKRDVRMLEALLDVRSLRVANIDEHRLLVETGRLTNIEQRKFYPWAFERFDMIERLLKKRLVDEAIMLLDGYFMKKNLLGLCLLCSDLEEEHKK